MLRAFRRVPLLSTSSLTVASSSRRFFFSAEHGRKQQQQSSLIPQHQQARRKQQQPTTLVEEQEQEDEIAMHPSPEELRRQGFDEHDAGFRDRKRQQETVELVTSLGVQQEMVRREKLREIFAPAASEQDQDQDDSAAPLADPESLRLTEYQRKLLKERRAEEYSILRRNFLKAIDSHHDLVDKCHILAALHRRLESNKMKLHADIYHDYFATFVRHGMAVQADYVSSDKFGGDLMDRKLVMAKKKQQQQQSSSSSTSSSRSIFRQRTTALHVADFGFSDSVWQSFEYFLATYPPSSTTSDNTDNSSGKTNLQYNKLFQHVMRCLQFGGVSGGKAVLEERAHRVMVELEKRNLSPSMATLASYINICSSLGSMHVAMAAYIHALSAHQLSPTPALCTAVINGFLKNGDVESAVNFVSNMQNVALDDMLFNTVLTALRESSQPMAAFAAFRTIVGAPDEVRAIRDRKRDPNMLEKKKEEEDQQSKKVQVQLSRNEPGSTALPVTEATITVLLGAWRKEFVNKCSTTMTAAAVKKISSSRSSKQKKEDAVEQQQQNDTVDDELLVRRALLLELYRELQFVVRTSVSHRVKCGEHTLNQLVQGLNDVAQKLLELRDDEVAMDKNKKDDKLEFIASRCRASIRALVHHMQLRGVRVHKEKVSVMELEA